MQTLSILLAIAALGGAGVLVAFFGRPGRAPDHVSRRIEMLPLFEAAEQANINTQNMVIAHAAAKQSDPVVWFAQSIASVVAVYRAEDAERFVKLPTAPSIGSDLQSLYIRKRDYRTYLAWARTLQ
jgi:hypothetical protein